ncbi:uncharacterized protein LOC124198476 isoform X2 [Daphnia pulex]|uniref:uncharacterized protein LOC124198476 isoform X2 n=1 Tax=Daphnia pulex TaxID=6669 RepID=UPI001EDF6A7A|nr:uncharacterized protein LOC124198476 isoform X2 [Daphnia pulex]XP_046642337.1 uncharacterized protein LOC124327452 isoform X2 [Daphnia pulicaria]
MLMYQFFWFGDEIEDFIFKGVNISGWKVTFCKEMFHSSIDAQHQGQAFVRDAQILQIWTSSWKMHVFQSIASFIQITLGYFVMLIVMSFNVYLMMAVIIGSTSGFFLLNPLLLKKRSILNPPHILVKCQAEECGSLIDGEQVETQRVGNSIDNSKASNQLIVSASIKPS